MGLSLSTSLSFFLSFPHPFICCFPQPPRRFIPDCFHLLTMPCPLNSCVGKTFFPPTSFSFLLLYLITILKKKNQEKKRKKTIKIKMKNQKKFQQKKRDEIKRNNT